MALINDPDDLSQGLKTDVSDAAWTSSSGANTTITSSGNLPTLAAGDFFEVRFHSVPGNNGLYIATGTPTASSLPATKVDGTNPTDQTAEDVDVLGDNGAATEYKMVMIDTGQKFIYLLEKGNLSADGATWQALYSFFKEEWKSDTTLIQHTFPMVAVTPEQFELIEGWKMRNVAAQSIRTEKLLRTGGWSEIDANDYLIRQFTGVVTLGTFEDSANDKAHYQLGTDQTDTGAATDFTFAGPVDEAVQTYSDVGVPGDVVVTTNNTITSATGDFVNDGFAVGGQVTIQDAEDPANDGTWTLTSVSATVLVVSGTPLTNNADDTTMRLAVDNRNALQLFLRVRDADPNGKTFDYSDISLIGFTTVDNKAFRFPLSNETDLNISETDANIAANTPYTEIRVRYLDAAYNREVDNTTKRNFGIIVDVGTYSESNGASNSNTLFTSANLSLGAGEALADYNGGDLIIHEGTDQGTHTIVGTPVNNSGTLEITLSGALTASESNLSFTMERATPLTANTVQIYEKVQYLLRQDADIDSTDSTVTGSTADELLDFIGSDLKAGLQTPNNPNGGGSGVLIEGFDTNYTNNLFFFDNGGTQRNYPYVAAGSIGFNKNLYPDDSAPEYWMYFEYISRTTVADFAISGASGSTASFDSAGSNLPVVSQYDYVRLTDMTNTENNGVWLVTDASPTQAQFDATKVDGQTVVNESAASHPVDWKPIDSPQAIIVNDNGGSPIEGAIGAASVSFDFDYDGNVQGGRSSGTDAAIVIRAIGVETGKFAETLGTITRATGLSYSVVAELERNYTT